jgi:hypothetical protein
MAYTAAWIPYTHYMLRRRAASVAMPSAERYDDAQTRRDAQSMAASTCTTQQTANVQTQKAAAAARQPETLRWKLVLLLCCTHSHGTTRGWLAFHRPTMEKAAGPGMHAGVHHL